VDVIVPRIAPAGQRQGAEIGTVIIKNANKASSCLSRSRPPDIPVTVVTIKTILPRTADSTGKRFREALPLLHRTAN
jgi:hypothetical protein